MAGAEIEIAQVVRKLRPWKGRLEVEINNDRNRENDD